LWFIISGKVADWEAGLYALGRFSGDCQQTPPTMPVAYAGDSRNLFVKYQLLDYRYARQHRKTTGTVSQTNEII
jgi:hypothetical protein